jgi:hypothetical protein
MTHAHFKCVGGVSDEAIECDEGQGLKLEGTR